MKKWKLLFLLSWLLAFVNEAKATHIMGGEITWECLNTGAYVFTLKVYRDCNGVPLNITNEGIEAHNYPAPGAITPIPLTFFSVTDITPSCEGSPCSGLTAADPDIPGAIEEYILKSNPIVLNGVPGLDGWVFTWTSGNRNAAIDNIQNADNFGITLRAKMFNYNGQNANACFDSSPDFFQKPSSIICAGEDFTYNHSAYDNELDSLVYSWAEPLDGNFCNIRPCAIGGTYLENVNPANIPFDAAQGYSSVSPFPGITQDPRNVPAVLNPLTGEISFTSFNQGEFVSVIRVEAYKCGQKIAEVYRELQTVILSGCASNEPPSIPAPFANGTFSDTVRAGEFIQFDISIFDTLTVDNPKNDSIFIYGSGQQFGANFTDSTTGCLNPPCATLTAPLVDTGVGTYNTQFKWQTSCVHIANSTPICYASQNTYLFIIRAFDDFCPAAGQTLATFNITVLADSLADHPDIHCADVQNNGDVILDWNQPRDSDSSFFAYMIYNSAARNGPYVLIDSIFDFNQTTYTHTGAGADLLGQHYLVRTRSGCHDGWTIAAPDTISTLFIDPSFNSTCVEVDWNVLDTPLPSGSPNFYNVYREYPIGSGFSLYQTVNGTSFCDTFSVCTDSVTYRIEMTNAGNGCAGSNSNVRGIRFQYPLPLAEAGTVLDLCTGQSGLIGGSPSGPIGSSYSWSPTSNINNTAIANPLVNPTASTRYYLQITDSNNCVALDSVDVLIQASPVATAGANTLICKEDFPFALQGTVSVTDSGRWLGGTGVFGLGRNHLNSPYTPSNAEIAAGFVELQLLSENIGICDPDTDLVRIDIPPFAATLNANSNPVDCNGGSSGSASLTASGPNAPYSFSWNGPSGNLTGSSQSNLQAGVYTITVSNSLGCDSITSITLTEPAVLSSSISSSANASCNGIGNGQASVSATGGNLPYTYLWSNGQTNQTATGLGAGTFQVSVTDAKSCQSVSSITITEPTAIASSFSNVNPVSCFGLNDGSASVGVTGGVAPYTYLWSNGQTTNNANNLSAQSYGVTVSDANGCTQTRFVSIVQPAQLVSSISNSTQVSCNGLSNGNASLAGTGGTSPYTYLWSDGQTSQTASNLSAGNYSATLTDAKGCTSTSNFTITEPNGLNSAVANSSPVSCNGLSDGTATGSASGGTSPYTYSWSSGQNTANASGLSAGTYTLSVQDAQGCTSSVQTTISEPASLLANSSIQNQVSCQGGSSGNALLSPSGGNAPYTYAWSNGASTAANSGLSAGTYTYTVTDSKGCTAGGAVQITEPSQLVISSSNLVSVSCNGLNNGSATLLPMGGTAPYSYLWSNGQTTNPAINLFAGSYAVTLSDANGCTSIGNVNINEPLPLQASINSSVNVSCLGLNNGSADVFASGGTAPYTYLWSDGQSSAQAVNLTAGTYRVTISDANSCTSNTSISISEPNALIGSFANVSPVSCKNLSDGSASIFVNGGTSPFTYAWSNGQTNAAVSSLAAGNYRVTVSDAQGCTLLDSLQITEPDSLLIGLSNSVQVSCNGLSNGSASLTVTGGTSPYVYAWSNGQTANQASNLSAGSYSVTVTDINTCSAVLSLSITEPALLNSQTASLSDASCFGFSDGSAAVQVTGGTRPYTYLWSDGQSDSLAIGLTAGSYQLTITDAQGCLRVNSFLINEPNDFQNSLFASNISCAGLNDGFIQITSIGGTGPYAYNWSDGGNGAIRQGLDSGLYRVFIQDLNSCYDTLTYQITEPSALQLSLTADDTICINVPIDLVANASGGTGLLTYTWNQNLGGNSRVTVNPSARTRYSVNVTDQNGCPALSESTIIEVRNIFNDYLAVSSSGNICLGDSSLIKTDFRGGLGPFTYNWNQSLVGLTDQYVSPSTSTWYILSIQDECQNQIQDSVLVEVSPLPPLNLPDTLITACAPVSIQLDNFSDPNLIYAWDLGDGNVSTSPQTTHTYTQAGTYSIGLSVRTQEGCENNFTGQYDIQVNPSPEANFSANPLVTTIDFPTINFFAFYQDASAWNWEFGDGISSTVREPIYNYLDTGTFVVQFSKINSFGCTDTNYLGIRIEPSIEIKIPNVFIPNTGGSTGGRYNPNGVSNAIFHPFLDYVEDYEMQIFNRWGELIFESKDLAIGWDGYYKGKLSQADVYVYKLKVKFINGETATKIGDVTLLR